MMKKLLRLAVCLMMAATFGMLTAGCESEVEDVGDEVEDVAD